MVCEFCNNGSEYEEETCCGDIALRVHQYKRKVLHLYILEAIFDMVVSTISVVLDITTLVVYTTKGNWDLAILTAFPVILPTTVFTNVYMTDENRGYCKMPKNKRKRGMQNNGSKNSFLKMVEDRSEGQRLGFFNCLACWSGTLHSIFHKDQRIRKRGAKLAKRSVSRSLKYLFGTLVLRFIAWAWYLKAIFFGIKAMRQPKKFMKMEQPEEHWSRELLIRLDFLQAALENAPQCVIQLYTLLTYSDENRTLGILTLSFSFIDFIRVATTVFWNINKGPIVAPEGCYGSFIWQILNISSWVFLYMARCSGLCLVFGTAFAADNTAVIAVPIIAALLHFLLFAKLFSTENLGQASKKYLVTTFISIFFLPELDVKNVNLLVQFYYAMTLLENTFFVIPWRGLEFSGYCFHQETNQSIISTGSTGTYMMNTAIKSGFSHAVLKNGGSSSKPQTCLIDPVVIVVLVPALTMIGIVIRLASIQKMASSNSLRPAPIKALTMEERVANIYNKKWTTMTVRQMWSAFMHMLRKETTPQTKNTHTVLGTEKVKGPFQIEEAENYSNSISKDANQFPYKSCTIICHDMGEGLQTKKSSEMSPAGHNALNGKLAHSLHMAKPTYDKDADAITFSRKHSLPRQFFSPASYQSFNNPGNNILKTLDVRFLKVETSNGTYAFETSHI